MNEMNDIAWLLVALVCVALFTVGIGRLLVKASEARDRKREEEEREAQRLRQERTAERLRIIKEQDEKQRQFAKAVRTQNAASNVTTSPRAQLREVKSSQATTRRDDSSPMEDPNFLAQNLLNQVMASSTQCANNTPTESNCSSRSYSGDSSSSYDSGSSSDSGSCGSND